MKKRTVQILRVITALCLFIALTVIPGVVFAADDSFTVTETVLADETTVWRYLDNGTDPAQGYDSLTAWIEKDYDDTLWKSGAGCFGSKNGKLQTIYLGTAMGFSTNVLLDLNAGMNNYHTYFFRTTLNVDTLDDVHALSLVLNADDGAVVYINGTAVVDTRVTKNDSSNLYYTSSNNQLYRHWFTADELKEFLTVGENTVAVSVHNSDATSSDVFFNLESSLFYVKGGEPNGFDDVVMTVGADETERNLTWYTFSDAKGEVQLAKVSDMRGDSFPAEYISFSADTVRAGNSPCEYTNKATLIGLLENTEYVYRLKCGDYYSDNFKFKTESFDSFDLVLFGDPQIRSWTDTLATPDYVFWHDSILKVSENFDADLYLSAGDQVNIFDLESDYEHFITEQLASTPLAPTVGNHDIGSSVFKEHFYVPNESTAFSSNYWFKYNNVLFITVNNFLGTVSSQLDFIESAVAMNPECEWKVLMMHYSPYSAGSHSSESIMESIRSTLVPNLNDLGIDLVIGGHDHIYTRSYLMDEGKVAPDQSTVDTSGVLYICSGSAGGKFYDTDKVVTDADYVAFTHYDASRTVIHIGFTDTSLTLNTYLLDDMSVIDTYELTHSRSSKLTEAINNAEKVLENSKSAFDDSALAPIRDAIASAKAVLADMTAYTDAEILAAINLLNHETGALSDMLDEYNKLSAGAKETVFDTAKKLTIFHLKDGGVYTLGAQGGSRVEMSLIQHHSDGTEETVFTWTEGATYISMAASNPYVAFILDGDVTINSTLKIDYTNLLIDLNGHTLTFNATTAYHVNVSGAASIEFRGEGELVAGSGTVDYFVSTAAFLSNVALNGNITFIDGTSALKNAFFFKGNAQIYGTLTIDASYDSSTGIVFGMQGSRSSADDRKAIVTIEDATVNYNNPRGAGLFGAKGISGEYNGKTYTSIPQLNITRSRINLHGSMITAKWGADSVSGYADSKSEALTNCVNTTLINITDSYIYSDINANYPVMMTPSGHTTINITRSTLYSEHGVIIQGILGTTLDINAIDSTFYAGTTDAEATELGAALGVGAPTSLRGEVLYAPANTLGTANFTGCSLTAAYRIIEGTSDTISKRTYFVFLKDSSASLTNGGGHMFARINLVFDGGLINCTTGKLSNNATPYNPDTGKGLLVKGTVTIINFPSSKLDDEITTVSAYKKLAESDSTVYETKLTSGYFTVADDFNVLSITHEDNTSDKHAFILYSTSHAPILTATAGKNPTCTEDGINGYYTCFCGDIFADAEGTILIEDLEAYLPVPALGHKGGEAVRENEILPDCLNTGSHVNVIYCALCGIELSRENITTDALGHNKGEITVENNTLPTCTENGGYDNVIYCTLCGDELSRETFTFDALGHSAGKWIVDSEADCLNAGSMHKECTVCGAITDTLTNPALGHSEGEIVEENVIAPDCLNNGSLDEVVYCTACGYELSRDTLTLLARGHVGGTATCAEPKKCDDCGEYYGDKLEHSFTNYVHDGNATCTDDGTKTAYCDHLCGASDTVENTGFAPGHSYGEWVSNADGTHTRVCANNSEHTETADCHGGTATEDSRALCSDCHGEYGKLAESDTGIPETPGTPEDSAPVDCDHLCHSDSPVQKLIWSIIRFFLKLFGMNDTCPCGTKHY